MIVSKYSDRKVLPTITFRPILPETFRNLPEPSFFICVSFLFLLANRLIHLWKHSDPEDDEALEAEDEKDGGGQVGDRRDVGGAHDRFPRFEVNMASIRPVTRNPPTTLMVARTTATNPSVVVNVE